MNRKMQDMTILITMETNNRSNANLIEENKIETDITIKYNNKITDETKILENEQLVQELEEQIWLLEVVASKQSKDVSKITIKDLKDIREVSINSTSIPNNSVIPKIIGRFESLKSIKVNGDESSCNLYYPLNTFQTNGNLVGISEEIGKCINLEEVNFSFNNLKYLPKELFRIENITKLNLSSTALKRIDGITSEICNLTNLTHLYLSSTYIDINDVKSLAFLENLQVLDIASNMIVGDIKEVCHNIKVSEKLDMHINSFYGNGKYLLNYDDGVTIYCYSNLIYFSNEDVVKFEQYNEREKDKNYGYREFAGNIYNNRFAKYKNNKSTSKIANINKDITIKKGSNINEIYSLYKEGIRVLNYYLEVEHLDNKVFREKIPYKINIKNLELFNESGIAIKDGIAKIEVKYDDEAILLCG